MAKKQNTEPVFPQFDHNTVLLITAGGPYSGANYFLNSVIQNLAEQGMKAIGIRSGFEGLLNPDPDLFVDFSKEQIPESAMNAESFLGCSKAKYNGDETIAIIQKNLKRLGVKKIILSGGDGSIKKIRRMLEGTDIQFVLAAKTHDGDFHNYISMGLDSFVSRAIERLKLLARDARANRRIVVEGIFGGKKAEHTSVRAGIAANHVYDGSGVVDGVALSGLTDFRLLAINLTKRIATKTFGPQKTPHAVVLSAEAYKAENEDGQFHKEVIAKKLKQAFQELAQELNSKTTTLNKDLSLEEKQIIQDVASGKIAICQSRNFIGHGDRLCDPSQTDIKLATRMGADAVTAICTNQTDVCIVGTANGGTATVKSKIVLARSKHPLDEPRLSAWIDTNPEFFGTNPKAIQDQRLRSASPAL